MPGLAGSGTTPMRALWLLYDPDTFEGRGFVCSLHLLRTPDEPHASTRLRTAAVIAARGDWHCQFCD